MTLFEIAFSIPGIVFMCVVGPWILLAALELVIGAINTIGHIINDIAAAFRKKAPITPPVAANVIRFPKRTRKMDAKDQRAWDAISKQA